MRTLFILLGLISVVQPGVGQTALDTYIRDGLENNIVLQQKNISLDQALLGLKIARGSFLPSVSFQGSYTSGKGGRSIALPIGDIMNPVYSTLNQLTGSESFPQIDNISQDFFPYNFYDVRIRTTMPLFNSNLIYNRRISEQQTMMQSYEVETYKRELVFNIKTAYFNYLSAYEASGIYENALNLALEGKRVNESLLQNGKGLPAYVIRSEGEIESVRALMSEAKQQELAAKRYFNFLLNREADHNILTDYIQEEMHEWDETVNFSPLNRPEMKQVQHAVLINQAFLRMNKAYWTPKVSGFVDVGSQESDWQINNQSAYFLLGVQVEVPLFAGMTNKHRIEQSEKSLLHTQLSQQNLENSLYMKVANSRNSLEAAIRNYESAIKQEEAAKSYQKLIDRGYKEGIHSFIESVDARNQLTNARLQTTITLYQVLMAEADYEREIASYQFEDLN